METRKVQVTGNSTYVVSLPKMWIMETGIKKGDGLRLHLHSDGAILLTLASNENDLTDIKESDIEIEDSLDNVARRFIGLYLAGYDIIHFKFRTGLNAKGKNKIKKNFVW
jgi:phosphate uptake regulator